MANDSFDYASLLQIKRMSLEELNSYYRLLRKHNYEEGKLINSSEVVNRMHSLKMLILKIDKILCKRSLVIFDDKRQNNFDCGKIYASSHVGRYDIESSLEAINEPAYFVMGDPEETYRNFEGLFLEKINGRICLDTGYQIYDIMMKKKDGLDLSFEEQKLYDEYKTDRHIGEIQCEESVKNGDNILIFPEGAWNVTERLTQTLFPGTARIAINSSGIIIPIGIIRNGKKYTVNIGKEFNVKGAQISDTADITSELKELINSLKGEIIFSDGSEMTSRASLKTPEENLKDYVDDIMSETTNGYTLDVIEKTRFYDSNYPENVLLNKTRKLS